MELLRSVLKNLPEFQELTAALEGGKSPAAVSGLAAVHRAHFAAALGQETGRPVVVVCADEGEAGRMARDLSYLTGGEVPVLASRSFVFHSIATVSHQWEHKRLDLLWRLRRGELPCLVATVEALQQRTLPPQVLDSACTVLEPGRQADLNRLTEALAAAGYVRCDQVEGAGQFALRGGILDVYSPGMAAPVRAEFWGDELDTMGTFDPSTQRRTENVDRAVLLPAAETLPQLSQGGMSGLLERLDQLSAKARRDGNEDLAVTLQQDRDALGEGRSFPAADRYLPLIYPELATAADFLPLDACVLFSESSRVGERAKTYQWQLEEDVKTLLERGELDGSCGELCLPFDRLCRRLEDLPFAYLDSFSLSSYPLYPKCLLSVMAKQLPSFGASLETAVQDLSHYQSDPPAGAEGEVRGGLRPEGPAQAGADHPHGGGTVRRAGVPGSEAGRHHRGSGGGRKKTLPLPDRRQEGPHQPAEAEVLRRPVPRGPGGPRAPRGGPVRGHGEDARRRH